MAEKKTKSRCFVITPIGNETDPIRRHMDGIIDAAVAPALEEKYEIVVAHRIASPGPITKQIIREIYLDELVVANLTTRNPNVMYELAFRHSLGKPVIIIAEKGTALPFDVSVERVVFYENDAQGVLDLREALIKSEMELDFSPELRSGMIYDMVREIDKDARIVEIQKRADAAGGQESDALQYILQRLDTIESKIQPAQRRVSARGQRQTLTATVHLESQSAKQRMPELKNIHDRLNADFSKAAIDASVSTSRFDGSMFRFSIECGPDVHESTVADQISLTLRSMKFPVESIRFSYS